MPRLKTLILLPLSVFFLLTPNPSAFTEDITITTYYPAPYGVYKELRSKRVAIGDNYYDGGEYCWEGICTNDIDDAADLIVEGKVGIGTASPGARKLKVNGDIETTSRFYGDGSVPAGAIMMFDTSCPPSEWTRFTTLDGKVPRGASTYGGTTGASETHTHSGPRHVHGMSHTHSNACTNCHGGKWTGTSGPSSITTTGAGGTGQTGSTSSWPPYLNVVWCKKK